MTTLDIVTIALSIGLSVVSVGLAIFSIWLSVRFNEASAQALDAVKDLARETRTLVGATLSQQENFSLKMLDSILEQTRYGTSYRAPEPHPIVETEAAGAPKDEALISKVEQTIQRVVDSRAAMDDATLKAISDIKEEIVQATMEASRRETAVIKSPDLKTALKSFLAFPAHYALLAAILRAKPESTEQLKEIATETGVPLGWEVGVKNLIKAGILEGTPEAFHIAESYLEQLNQWRKINRSVLNRLMSLYRRAKGAIEERDELAISHLFEF